MDSDLAHLQKVAQSARNAQQAINDLGAGPPTRIRDTPAYAKARQLLREPPTTLEDTGPAALAYLLGWFFAGLAALVAEIDDREPEA